MPAARRRPTEKQAYWLDRCRRHSVKSAAMGESGDDAPFEQAFANLATAYLKDKAPGLLDYQVGFQLVDRDEDNTRAVGIFGFKVGTQWLYAPVFFLDGDLKGHELLYLKDQDAFVPLKENWVNYLLNKKPLSLGQGVSKDTRQLGVQLPDLQRIVRSPAHSKLAAALPPWLAHAMPGLAYAMTTNPYTDPRYAGMATLPDVVKAAGVRGVQHLRDVADTYPTLREPLDRFYGPALPAAFAAVKEAAARGKADGRSLLAPGAKAVTRNRPGRLLEQKRGSAQVIVYNPGRVGKLDPNTDDDRLALIRDGYKVVDDRRDEETSRAFRGDVPADTARALTNPTESGLYDCLVKPGEFAKCVVIVGPHGPSGRRGFATVVKAEDDAGKRGWINVHPSYVWVGKQYSDEDFQAWVEKAGKPSAEGVSTEEGKQFVLVNRNGDGTLPFIVEGEFGDPDAGYRVFKVRFDLFADKPRPAYMLGQSQARYGAIELARNSEGYDRWTDGERVHLGGKKGTKLKSDHGDLFVPKEMFALEVEPADYPDDQWDAPDFEPEGFKRQLANASGGQGKSETPPVLAINGAADATLGFFGKTAELAVRFDGAGGSVNGGPYLSRVGVLRELVVKHALRERVAREIMDECEAGRFKLAGTMRRYRIAYPEKSAAPHDYGGAGLAGQGPGAPGFPDPRYGGVDPMGSPVPSQGPQADLLAVPGMQADPSAAASQMPMGPDRQTMGVAQQAAQMGQKEIFDTAAIGSLLKATRDDQLTDQYVPDLMKGMDRIGRIIMNLLWKRDQFEERYGKSEIPELEDSLRNTFEDIGDLTLYLRQRNGTSDPQIDAQRINLQHSAD